MDRLWSVAVCVGAAALVGCGSPPTIESFTATPAEVSSKDQVVTLSWVVKDAYEIGITGVGKVSASGSLEVSPERVGSYELTATNPWGSVSQRASVLIHDVTVSGKVVNQRGQPVAQAEMWIDGASAWRTNADGAFFAPLLPPYQVTVRNAAASTIVHYGRLTTDAPVVTLLDGPPSFTTQTIRGTIVGANVDTYYRVVWISRGREIDGTVAADHTFSIRVAVEGRSETGDIVAFRPEPVGLPMPTQYLAFGRAESIEVLASQERIGVMVPVTAPTVETIQPVVDGGSLSPLLLGVSLDFGDHTVALGMRAAVNGVTDAIPSVPGATPRLWALFEGGDGARSTAQATGFTLGGTVALDAPQVPVLLEPAAGATLTKAGTLRWSGGPGLCEVRITPQLSGPPVVFAAGWTELPVEALYASKTGLVAANYSWKVVCREQFTVPDDFVAAPRPPFERRGTAESALVPFVFAP